MYVQADDGSVPHIVHSLRMCIDLCLSSAPTDIRLRRFVAQSYMGLFLEEEAASWFRELAKKCAADIKKHSALCVLESLLSEASPRRSGKGRCTRECVLPCMSVCVYIVSTLYVHL